MYKHDFVCGTKSTISKRLAIVHTIVSNDYKDTIKLRILKQLKLTQALTAPALWDYEFQQIKTLILEFTNQTIQNKLTRNAQCT